MTPQQMIEAMAEQAGAVVQRDGCRQIITWPDDRRRYSASERWAWEHMIRRCTEPSHPAWDRYGGRGIKVCDRWLESFAAFAEDMGPKLDPALTLDRIDNDAGYEPGNCRWATRTQQMRNMSRNRLLTIDGETMPVSAWAERSGVNRSTIFARIYKGWAPKAAVFTVGQRSRLFEVDGIFRTVAEWSEVSGVAPQTIRARIRSGRSGRDAVFARLNKRRR
jgi:hypothetical protein